uniref:Mitochondria-eating protein n=1 Tax=Ditylenchus dipsaci TaxID=166011 RepID=A0A915E5Y5_9BILA
MLNKILWWLAITFQHDGGEIKVSSEAIYQSFFIEKKQKTLNHLRSVLLVIQQQNPQILNDILTEKSQLNDCLESLGCHGLVNCPVGFIGLMDAVLLETVRQQDRLKAVITRLKLINKMDMIPKNEEGLLKATSAVSHQRQVNLRLSQIYERLRQNNVIENILEEILQNKQLSSLLRIVQKRIKADKILIGLFNSYMNNKPAEFSLSNNDPVVAKLILLFKCAYEEFSSLLLNVKSAEKLSLSTMISENIYAETSRGTFLEDTSTTDFNFLKDRNSNNSLNQPTNYGNFKFTGSLLKTDVIRNFAESETFLPSDPDASLCSVPKIGCRSSKQRDIEKIIKNYSSLRESFYMFDEEFRSCVQLKENLPLFAIVQAYQAVKKVFEMHHKKALNSITISAESAAPADVFVCFKNATYKLIHTYSKTIYQTETTKELLQQVTTKFDIFVSDKQNMCLESYVKDCVDIAWDIVGAIQDTDLPSLQHLFRLTNQQHAPSIARGVDDGHNGHLPHTQKCHRSPPSAVENLSFLLEHASEVVLNSTEMASLSNYTVGLFNATELTPLVRGSLLNDLTANAVVDGNYTAPFHLTAKYVPLWNASHVGKTWSTQHFDRRLVGPIEVGTPGVEYKMHFDNGRWKDSVLFADPVNFHEIKLYNFAKDSSTHTSITYTKKVVNGSGTFEQTDKREDISDVFRISKAHSIRQNFVVMDSVKENEEIAALFKVLPADGILSLSSAPKSSGSFPSFLNASLADMRDQVVTFHVERVSNFTEKEQSASLSFGDLDPVHCNKDNWTMVPQLNLNNWAFHMGALKFTFGGLLANNTVLQVLKQEVQDTKVETGLGNSTANSVEVPKAIQDTITNNSSVSTKTESAGDTKHTQILIKNPSDRRRNDCEGLSYAPAEHVKFMADVLSATKNISVWERSSTLCLAPQQSETKICC